jgi:hypothetical protein
MPDHDGGTSKADGGLGPLSRDCLLGTQIAGFDTHLVAPLPTQVDVVWTVFLPWAPVPQRCSNQRPPPFRYQTMYSVVLKSNTMATDQAMGSRRPKRDIKKRRNSQILSGRSHPPCLEVRTEATSKQPGEAILGRRLRHALSVRDNRSSMELSREAQLTGKRQLAKKRATTT